MIEAYQPDPVPFLAARRPARCRDAAPAADVRDGGEFFSPHAEREANQLMQQIRQRHGKDVVVETCRVAAERAGRHAESADELLRRRGRPAAAKAGVNGVVHPRLAPADVRATPGVDPRDADGRRSRPPTACRVARPARRPLQAEGLRRRADRRRCDADRPADGGQRVRRGRGGGGPRRRPAPPPAAAERPAAERPRRGRRNRAADRAAPAAGRRGMGMGGWLCLIVGGARHLHDRPHVHAPAPAAGRRRLPAWAGRATTRAPANPWAVRPALRPPARRRHGRRHGPRHSSAGSSAAWPADTSTTR